MASMAETVLCARPYCKIGLQPAELQTSRVVFGRKNVGRRLTIRRHNATDKTVSTPQEEEQGLGKEEAIQSQQEEDQEARKQKEIGDALRELRKKEDDQSSGFSEFWNGLLQEIGLIEWPDFGKVFGTTLVVLGIIIGSSVVLLTVNLVLAELSDVLFKVQPK